MTSKLSVDRQTRLQTRCMTTRVDYRLRLASQLKRAYRQRPVYRVGRCSEVLLWCSELSLTTCLHRQATQCLHINHPLNTDSSN